MMVCTVIMTFLLSVNGGAFECRTKHFDRETAIQTVAMLNDPEVKNDLASNNIVMKNIKFAQVAPFKCGDEKVKPDDKHNGCLSGPGEDSGHAFASSH